MAGSVKWPALHFNSDPAWIDWLRDWAATRDDLDEMWLFGSRVTGVRRTKDRPHTIPDLDVLVTSPNNADSTTPAMAAMRELRGRFEPVELNVAPFDPRADPALMQWARSTGFRIWPG